MATTKVSALSALTTTDGNEELLINDGGTSKKVTIDNVLHDNSIRAEHYVDGSIATAHIADNAITSAKLGVDVIVAEDIANNAITVAELADNAVTTAKLNADAVTGAKIADDAIATEHIADDAVTAAKLANSINTEIAANTAKTSNATHTGEVTGATALTIADNVVDEANLKVSNSPTNGYFLQAQSGNTGGLTWAATSTSIADGSISTAKIADDAVTEAKLANAINTAIAANTAKTSNATHTGDVTGATELTIASGAVETGMIADDAVTAAKLANSINTEIAANTAKVTNATHTGDVTGATALTIADDVIDSQHYVNNSVTTAAIGNDQVTADKLANSINTDIATGVTANTTANAALPKAGGTMTGNTIHNDNVKSLYGTGSDLEIYHNGSNSYIDDSGTGGLFIRSNAVQIDKYTGETMIYAASDGAVNLYHNDALKIATTAQGVTVTGTAKATTDTDTSNSGNVALNFEANQNFVLTLTGNVTLTNPSFAGASWQVGQSGFIVFKQDGTGSRTVSLGTDYETAGGSGLTLTSTASASDVVPYIIAATNRILLGTPQLAFA